MKKGEMLSVMLQVCVNYHAGQFDKAGKAYILHPLRVMHRLRTDDEELQCIALAHDLIEDTKCTYNELRQLGISERVLEGIRCLTKERGESYDEYELKVKSNRDAILVKMQDLWDNSDVRRLKGVSEEDMERTAKYLKFYVELQDELSKENFND